MVVSNYNYLEPQSPPIKNGWMFGDFQPFPKCKDLMDENHPVDSQPLIHGCPVSTGWFSSIKSLHIGNGWKSPFPSSIFNWWALGFQVSRVGLSVITIIHLCKLIENHLPRISSALAQRALTIVTITTILATKSWDCFRVNHWMSWTFMMDLGKTIFEGGIYVIYVKFHVYRCHWSTIDTNVWGKTNLWFLTSKLHLIENTVDGWNPTPPGMVLKPYK